MAQTPEGARKIAAGKAGVTLFQYEQLVAAGFKWCSRGKHWERRSKFCSDSTRHDFLSASCNRCRSVFAKSIYVHKPRQSKRGARFTPARDGDKIQARSRSNRLVAVGLLPNPNDVPCKDCGHIGDDRRHEYDHYKGYSAEHQETVEAVCTICHSKRDNANAKKTHCVHGHEFTPENTIVGPNGRRCRTCRRAHDRGRRDAAYWREYRRKRKEGVSHG
jgi:hypothetical protein